LHEAAAELLARRSARRSLIDFTTYTKPDFEVGEHHRIIASELEAVERGEVDRLMVFAPPRHTKSELSSRRFPAWYLGRHPNHQLICATYSGEFALDFGRDVRGIVAAPLFRNVFPEVFLRGDSRAANVWRTSHGGISAYVGVGGAITGRGAHLALIDDPFKNREEADSEVRREMVWKWYSSTLRTRLMPGGKIVLVLTRWHEDDLAGRILAKQAKQWRVVELQAISNEHTDEEKALWPAWYPLEELRRVRADILPRDWSALYQQKPSPDEGTYFQRSWIKHWDELPKNLALYGTSDYAVTEGAGDYTVHRVWGVDPIGDIYRVAGWRGQTTADTWIEKKLDLMEKYRPLAWFGEAGVIQKTIAPMLTRRMRERKVFCRMEWVPSVTNKPTRARGIQARMSMGKVWFEPGANVDEFLAFPTGKNDDDVDTASMLGMALDEAHPAILPAKEQRPVERDRWNRAFNRHDEDDESWKVA
jgi:predicted phage terminase large subunit-like protein